MSVFLHASDATAVPHEPAPITASFIAVTLLPYATPLVDCRSVPAAAILVPVKGFDAAKGRLAPAIGAAERALLARTMAERVVDASKAYPVFIACDDEHVAAWAIARDARVVWTAGLDLNGSVRAGFDAVHQEGFARVIVSHADLPFAESLEEIAWFPGVTLVPDRHGDGTNVLSVATDVAFAPQYGRGSFARHLATFRAMGLAVRIAHRVDLQWDVDVPDDLPSGVLLPTGAAR